MHGKSLRKAIAVAVTLATGLLLLTACEKSEKGSGPPKAQTPEVAVMVVQPERATITTELPGRTSAYLVAEVRPQVNGIVQKRLFTEGSDVKAGEVLYQIDPALYQAAYNTAMPPLPRQRPTCT